MNSLCSIELLAAGLAGNLAAEEETALYQHLEVCESCSTRMEQMAGGSDWCQEAAALLTGDEFDDAAPVREDWSVVDFTVEHLEPSDEPNVLGRLGGYDVLEIIGRGGMGIVLKGFDRELKRCVAIKVLAPHLAHSPLARKRFAREAQAAAAVVHPHVLAIHQVQPTGRLPFLVMPLVAGESLAQRLAARGTLELKEILRIGMQAAGGLAAAHEQGLVHRDVKPANILLEKGVERAVLTDFGLARAADDVAMTRWGIIAGTPQYMSPEQAQGQALDGRSDLFSLGCVLYEMATGVSPFRADSTIATLRRLVDDQPQDMATLNSELPPWFIHIVERLLEKDPSRRFRSAAEVSELLERCLAHVQQPTTVELPEIIRDAGQNRARVFPSRLKNSSSGRIGTLVGILVVMLTLVSGAWWLPAMFGLTESQERSTTSNRLNRLTAALVAYAQEHGHYPASAIHGKDGKGGPPHSWRVEILPYLGHKALYDQYRFDELWDSEHNKTLLAKIPDVYRSPLDTDDSPHAAFFGVILSDAKAVFSATAAPVLESSESGSSGPGLAGGGPPVPGSGPQPVLIPPAAPQAKSDAPPPSTSIGKAEIAARWRAAGQWINLGHQDKREMLRRVKLDLVGLPPTDHEIVAFLNDDSPTAPNRMFESLITQNQQFTKGGIADGVFVPEGSTIFSRPEGARYVEILDGTMNTIALVEARRSIPWTKPEDLTFDSTHANSPLGGWFAGGWHAGYADGSVKFISRDTSSAVIRGLLTINGGEGESATSKVESDVSDGTSSQTFNDTTPRLTYGYTENRLSITFASDDGQTATAWGQRFGEQFDVDVTGTLEGSSWGTDIYTSDTTIAKAAVHAGLVKVGETATVTITIIKPPERFVGSTRNGVTTSDYESWPSAYIISRKKEAPLQNRVRMLQGRVESALQLLLEDDKAASEIVTSDAVLAAELEFVQSLTKELGAEHVLVMQSQEAFARLMLNEIGLRIDLKRARNPEEQKRLNRLSKLIGPEGTAPRRATGKRIGSRQATTASAWEQRFGGQFDVDIVGSVEGTIWGTDFYTTDSAIATAAVHAGLVKPGESATVTVTIVKPPVVFVASERNGVKSMSYSDWPSAYFLQPAGPDLSPVKWPSLAGLPDANRQVLIDATQQRLRQTPPNQTLVIERIQQQLRRFEARHGNVTAVQFKDFGTVLDMPPAMRVQDTAMAWSDRFGERFEVEITGNASKSVWGTDVYTADSSISTAAVHAGLVKVGEKATVIVSIVKSPEQHVGSVRNGVTTRNWGNYSSSYSLLRKTDVPPVGSPGNPQE